MRKICAVLILITLLFPVTSYAAEGAESPKGAWGRVGTVLGRGLLNAAGMPFEVSSTLVRETDMHPKAWPVTFVFRLATNLFNRITSTVHDVFFFPWYAPFTDDLSPWTEGLGLPDYPWQIE